MTEQQAMQRRAHARYLTGTLLGALVMESCLNCEFFRDGRCIKVDRTPPPDVIVYGCDLWTPDIPF